MKKSELKALIREAIAEAADPEKVLEDIANVLDQTQDDMDAILQIRHIVRGYFNQVGYKVVDK
jgi:hypothetical protein